MIGPAEGRPAGSGARPQLQRSTAHGQRAAAGAARPCRVGVHVRGRMKPRSPSGSPPPVPSTGGSGQGHGSRLSRRRRSRYNYPIPRLRWVALVLVGFLLSGAGGAVTFFLPAIDAAIHITGHSFTTPTATPGASASPGASATAPPTAAPVPVSGAPFTVLLLGSDNDGKFGAS